MQSTGYAAVVLHRKCLVTKQMQPDRFACKVKNAGNKMKKLRGRSSKCYAGDRTFYQVDRKENRWWCRHNL